MSDILDAMAPQEAPPLSEWEQKDKARKASATQWLASLKVGSKVAQRVAYTERFTIETIQRETPKFWILSHKKFYKETGKEYGVGAGWSNHGGPLLEPTVEMAEQSERYNLADKLKRVNWIGMTLAELRAMNQTLCDHVRNVT